MAPPSRVVIVRRRCSCDDDLAVEQIDVADELGDPARARRLVKVARGRDLFEPAGIHHANPVGHRHRLFLVVGDDDEGHAEPALQLHQFGLRAFAQLLVERGERLVEQQHLGRRASERASATRCCWPPESWSGLRFSMPSSLTSATISATRVSMSARGHAGALQPERDIVPHGEMRKQRVVLEHHVDRTLMRQDRRNVAPAEQDAAFVRRLEAGEHAQQRGLAAAARAQKRKELARSRYRATAGRPRGNCRISSPLPRCAAAACRMRPLRGIRRAPSSVDFSFDSSSVIALLVHGALADAAADRRPLYRS